MNERIYMTPEIEIVECYAEGVLCASSGTESLEETDGTINIQTGKIPAAQKRIQFFWFFFIKRIWIITQVFMDLRGIAVTQFASQ